MTMGRRMYPPHNELVWLSRLNAIGRPDPRGGVLIESRAGQLPETQARSLTGARAMKRIKVATCQSAPASGPCSAFLCAIHHLTL